jgi:hypothetical protein
MKIGRNDPCPCGSGKKYKKCCLEKEQEAGRSQQKVKPPENDIDETESNLQALPTPKAEEIEQEQEEESETKELNEAFDRRWEEFKKQDYEGKITLFIKTLDEVELMDEEMAFEMLNQIYGKAVEQNDRDRFESLVAMLRERLPDVYNKDIHYYLDWSITNALAADRIDKIPALARELAKTAGEEIDLFSSVVDQLAYHDQLSTVVEMIRIAWPLVKESDDIVPWGIDRFAGEAVNYEVFNYLEHHSSPDARPDAGDPELLERLEPYIKLNRKRLERYMAHLVGQVNREWKMEDFELKRRLRKPSDDFDEESGKDRASETGEQNLYFLTVEFLRYLKHEEGVSYTKGELARKHIQRYILERHAGELGPKESMLESRLRSRVSNKKEKRKPKPPISDHLLCPDRETLDRYLAGLPNLINPQNYKAAATFELVPAWMRFLESRQLIDSQQRVKTLTELHGLDKELLKIFENYPSDPALQLGMKRWREIAGLQS